MVVPQDQIRAAAAIIQRGGLVAFPTETVYGLGANALNPDAVRRIYEAKQRPYASPLIVHVADEAMARSLCETWPHEAEALARAFWPGPLTMVLKKAAMVPDVVTANLDSVAIRIPRHAVALELLREAGVPIAAPSANRFTEISPTTAQHVKDSLGSAVDMILDAGPATVGIESTVISLRRKPPVLLRPGMLAAAQLEQVTGLRFEREADKPQLMDMESPGLHPKHYAPKTPFYVLEEGVTPAEGKGRVIDMPKQADDYAARLYAELRRADQEGWDWIAVRRPPGTPEWEGIHDRLRRASAR